MIEPNEIRFNNIVHWISNDLNVQIYNIYRSYVRAYVDNELEEVKLDYEDIEGVGLTEEILLKCGFVFKGGDGFMSPHNTEHWYFSLGIGFIPNSYKNSIKSDGYVGVKYLHELQNLYYHLFRTELDIKL